MESKYLMEYNLKEVILGKKMLDLCVCVCVYILTMHAETIISQKLLIVCFFSYHYILFKKKTAMV